MNTDLNVASTSGATKRSPWITIVIAVQLLYSLFLGSLSIYLLFLSHFWKTRTGPKPGDAAIGFIIAAAILVVPALMSLAGWLGLRREKRWGWWLTLLADVLMLGMLVYSLIDDGWQNIDLYMVALTVTSAMVTVLVLSPTVRKFYWQRGQTPSLPLSSSVVENS